MTKLFQQQAPLAARQFQLLKDTTVHNEDEVGYCETLMAGRSSNGPSTSNPSAVGRERSVRFCASPDDDFSTTDTDGSSDTTVWPLLLPDAGRFASALFRSHHQLQSNNS